MPRTFLNAFNQPVIEYDWDEFVKRLNQRLPYTGKEDLTGKTIVIKHTWGLGDSLYATPAVHALRKKWPKEGKTRIIFISSFPDMLEGNPDIDELYDWRQFEDFHELGNKLGDEKWFFVNFDTPLKGGFDYKINLRSGPTMNEYLKSLLSKDPKTLTGDEADFYNQASNTVINRYKMVALDMYCAHLGFDIGTIPAEDMNVYYYPYDSELNFATDFLKNLRKAGHKPIVLFPHTSTTYKDYPHWKEVIKLCPWNYHWLILGHRNHPGETWTGLNVSNCIGAFNLRHSAAVTIQSDLCCSSDTGLLYTKAARGGKCVVTYGPHEPAPFLHYFPSAHGLRIDKLRKTPGMEDMCSVGCYIDTEGCHKKGTPPPCLQELDPQVVADKIQEVMESKS